MEVAAGIYAGMVNPDAALQSNPAQTDLQKMMLAATPDCIKIVSLDGTLLAMNRAGCLALNVPEESGFGMPWLPLLPEEVHPAGMEALRKAAAGQSARFPGKSLSAGGTVYWDNLLTPLVDTTGVVLSILCVSRDITEKVLLERQLEEAVARERLLAHEMRHRIKNLLSVVSGLIYIAEKEALATQTPEAATTILREKLAALARASDAVFAQENGDSRDMAPVDVGAVVTSVMQPYGNRCRAMGDKASIHHEHVTTFALLLHELATNSVKCGALGRDAGSVTIRWTVTDETINLTWIETGGPQIASEPERRGFGTEMVDRVVKSAQGRINRTWHAEGLVVDLHFPGFVQV